MTRYSTTTKILYKKGFRHSGGGFYVRNVPSKERSSAPGKGRNTILKSGTGWRIKGTNLIFNLHVKKCSCIFCKKLKNESSS